MQAILEPSLVNMVNPSF